MCRVMCVGRRSESGVCVVGYRVREKWNSLRFGEIISSNFSVQLSTRYYFPKSGSCLFLSLKKFEPKETLNFAVPSGKWPFGATVLLYEGGIKLLSAILFYYGRCLHREKVTETFPGLLSFSELGNTQAQNFVVQRHQSFERHLNFAFLSPPHCRGNAIPTLKE